MNSMNMPNCSISSENNCNMSITATIQLGKKHMKHVCCPFVFKKKKKKTKETINTKQNSKTDTILLKATCVPT